ncbi:MAG: ABC transporter substrate-binding protein [Clostridia bacterium]|nr:ABC transporter substrate-binding protein [Clostridia bacterium]
MTKKLLSLCMAVLLLAVAIPFAASGEALPYAKIDWYLGLTPQPGNAAVNDALNEYLMEKLGCEVNLVLLTSADWETRIGTMIASGQDMGILGFGSQSKSDYVIESSRGAYYPLDDLLEEYGQETKALFPDEIWDAMRIDGKIYGIPSLKDNGYFISLIYNDTMAQELGLDMENFPQHGNWRDLDALFYEVKEKRDAAHPEWADHPVSWDSSLVYPYNFAFETFLNDSYLAVCNIDGIMDVDGFDAETILNFYETPEYLEFALMMQRWVEDGIVAYDYEKIRDFQYDGGIFANVGWGYTYLPEYLFGDAYRTKMIMSDKIWTETNNYFSAGTCISANCANPEQAMRVLNLVNSDPFMATMMRFGVEGVDWVYGDDGKMTFDGTANEDAASRSHHYWYAAPVGNLTIVDAPEAYIGPDGIMLTRIMELNAQCLLPSHMGFVFDTAPIANELAACTNIVLEYSRELNKGQLNSQDEVMDAVEEFIEKLKANGSDKIVAEVQSQVDAWKAGK